MIARQEPSGHIVLPRRIPIYILGSVGLVLLILGYNAGTANSRIEKLEATQTVLEKRQEQVKDLSDRMIRIEENVGFIRRYVDELRPARPTHP